MSLLPQRRSASSAVSGSPYRRNRRRLLYAAALFVAFLALPPGLGIGIMMLAGAVRLGLLIARHGPSLLPRRNAGALGQGELAGTALGHDMRSGAAVTVPDQALAAHGLVLGASGAGKTTTLMTIMSRQIELQRPVVMIDLKGSPALTRELQAAATRAGRGLTVWSLDGATYWNPLAYGNATELKDKLIETERFTEPHYKRAAERYLQMAIRVLQETEPGRAVTMSRVVALLEPPRLAAAAAVLAPDRADQVREYIRSLTPDQLSAVRGLGSRLALLTESDAGRFLESPPQHLRERRWPDQAEAGEVDLRRALRGGEVILFSLNSSRYGQLAGQIGTMAVQDLVTAAGARLSEAGGSAVEQATVVIDEFSALGSDNLLALLARGRESGVGVLLATQELADLDRAGRGFREQVLGNTAVKIAHRQDVPESAEVVSRLSGTVKYWERTYSHRSGGGFGGRDSYGSSAKLVDRPVVEPSEAQTMRTGEAIVTTKVPHAETHVTRVLPPSRDGRGTER